MSRFSLELSSSVQIAAPRERVWQVFSDISRWTKWCGVCIRAEPVVPPSSEATDASDKETDFAWRAGQRIHLKFQMAGIGVPFNVTVTDAKPACRVAWASTKLSVTAVRIFTFSENPSGRTSITDHKLFTSQLLPLRLFYPRPIIRHMTEHMLADLKTECERVQS